MIDPPVRLAADDIGRLERLIEAYPFKPYRNYRVLSRAAQDRVMRHEVAATLEDRDGLIFFIDAPAPAAVVARRLAWDSTFFGVPMARIDYVLGEDAAATEAVLAACLDALRADGVRHVAGRADVADLRAVQLFERHQFRVMDALVTYTQRPKREPARDVRELGRIRELADGDGDELVAIARAAYAGYRGRFSLDPHLPADAAARFYVEWAEQCVARQMAETVLVSEGRDGRLLGFLAYRAREPVTSVGGVPVFGGGLGACRPDAPGAYAGLIRAGTIWAHERGGVAECQTQNYNFPVIRVYEAVGAHYVRAEYTLHAWLGAESYATL